MNYAPFFSVIIVNYNGGTYLQGALNSLKLQSFADFEVFVVDNASTDGSLDDLDLSRLPHFKLIRLNHNSGFAEGNNTAARESKGRWIVLLNADATATPKWLETLHREILAAPDVKMMASTQLRMDDPDQLDGVGDGYTAWGFAWRGGYLKPASTIPPKSEVFGPCGASAAYETQAFLDAEGFDESFFSFMEDVDLAFRLRLAGHTCVFVPDAVVHHKGGGLSGERSEFSVIHGSRNRIWTYFGNMPTGLLLLTLPGHLILTAYLIVWYFGRPYGKYVLEGTIAGWKAAFQVRKDRKKLRLERKISSLGLMRSFFWNPWPMSHHDAAVLKVRD